VLARLDAINEVLGIEVLSQSLLPALASLAADIKWRVRLAVIQHMPLLLNQVSAAFFGDKFTDMCLAWLSDPVFAVRCAAVDNLKVLHTRLGESWTCTCVIPKLETLTSNKSYLLRLTGLHAIQALSSCLSVSNAEKHLIPRVLHLAKDPVPNIRMNCARALLTLLKVLPASNSFRQVVVENLAELSSDSDRDVKAAAAQV
jgi:serine/threonine-protein phosphatase 2A regulatory subunit A